MAAGTDKLGGAYNDILLGNVPDRYVDNGDGTFSLAAGFNPGSPQLAKDAGGNKYLGEPKKQAGVLTSQPIWRIRKLVYSGVDFVGILWADGDTNFDNVWDNRESLAYSYLSS